jgi:hypothetical protein
MTIDQTTLSQIRAAAGSKGGKKTLKRYGKRYMKKLARWGGHALHRTYRMVPVDQNDFAFVNRETGQVKAFQSGKPVPPGLIIRDWNEQEPEWLS